MLERCATLDDIKQTVNRSIDRSINQSNKQTPECDGPAACIRATAQRQITVVTSTSTQTGWMEWMIDIIPTLFLPAMNRIRCRRRQQTTSLCFDTSTLPSTQSRRRCVFFVGASCLSQALHRSRGKAPRKKERKAESESTTATSRLRMSRSVDWKSDMRCLPASLGTNQPAIHPSRALCCCCCC